MLKRYLSAVLAVVMLLLCFAACGEKKEDVYEEIPAAAVAPDPDMRQTVLYYEDDYGFIVPVMKEIKWVEGIGAAAVSQLKANPDADAEMEYMGLNPILAADTELSLSIKDGAATLKLSKGAIAAEDATGEMAKVTAVVNTLTEFPTIDTVRIIQEGTDGTLPNGTDISKSFPTFDLNIMTTLSADDLKNASKVILFFEDESGTAIVPVTKYIGGTSDAYAAMNELVRGPGAHGLKSLMPEGTKLLNVDVDETGVATVEFSPEFAKIEEDAEKEAKLIKCIVFTFRQFDNIDEVRILVNGEEYKSTAETTMSTRFVNVIDTNTANVDTADTNTVSDTITE
jgi:germination protein M